MSVNSRIRQIREEKYMQRKEIADKLGISEVAYGKIENEKTKVKVDTLKRIAEILNEPLDKFFQDSKECNIIQHNQHNEQVYQHIQTLINQADITKIEALYNKLLESQNETIVMLKALLLNKEEKIASLEKEIQALQKS